MNFGNGLLNNPDDEFNYGPLTDPNTSYFDQLPFAQNLHRIAQATKQSAIEGYGAAPPADYTHSAARLFASAPQLTALSEIPRTLQSMMFAGAGGVGQTLDEVLGNNTSNPYSNTSGRKLRNDMIGYMQGPAGMEMGYPATPSELTSTASPEGYATHGWSPAYDARQEYDKRFNLPILHEGNSVGQINGVIRDGDHYVNTAFITDVANQGKGIGYKAYKDLADYLLSNGKAFYPGSTNQYSGRVWEKLREEYGQQDNPMRGLQPPSQPQTIPTDMNMWPLGALSFNAAANGGQ